ncbi:hypothetical protein EOA75_20875 [Mesorhizobium sp. M1A.F.Ca.IN.022.07.1.1]|uniref:hypothetical protein n=1 Tax=unclassified Mesorhizobium TaxID=325217 RepID=UPI000FCB9C90|nr:MULTISPECIES: hypothetical protein [unclassified Mesorhizobium]MDG4909391.1 hypothetical protein [Mesorhizobium sp. WSM4898]RUV91006.1 hypothetical protein EOA75_20875 [Mesorhizobium sp. M1A.F.Ca.IN.022.07.1.1]RUW03712.1 hypothetical protein EOA49_01680 [Mesorhizobium sp. M1A.F.Ca.IN.020.04.1.1]RUW13392.1 hypothetical protein EOA53_08765 [Mesorhizobium sp. M1A.F.Ca.IN.020.03.1.1]RWF72572.1 MAG: hypothetical protein EOQ34_11660 [Mesorhizobium sp.]
MQTDKILERYSHQKSNLSLALLSDEDGGDPTILIQGSKRALHLLAELLLAVADEKANDGFGMGPRSAGSFHFSATSEFGVYVRRLDE